MRVVSLACSNTEIVHALGCAERLVGVDDHSDFPELLVARLPRFGPDLDPDLDRVAALEPDLVLATLTVPGHELVVEALARRGVPFLAPEPVSLEDVYRDIVEIAGRLGVPERAGPLIAEMCAELSAPPPPADAPRVLVEWWPKPVIAPGRRSWATDVLHAAGARGLLEDEEVKSRPLADDEVLRLAPDAFVVSWCGVQPQKYRPDVVLRNPAWAELHDRTSESRLLVDAFTASDYFRVVGHSDDPDQLARALDHGDARVGIRIAPGFAADLRAGRGPAVQIVVDGSSSNTATVAQGYAGRIVQQLGQRWAAADRPGGVELRARARFNPGLVSRLYNVPAVIGVIVLLMSLLLTASSADSWSTRRWFRPGARRRGALASSGATGRAIRTFPSRSRSAGAGASRRPERCWSRATTRSGTGSRPRRSRTRCASWRGREKTEAKAKAPAG